MALRVGFVDGRLVNEKDADERPKDRSGAARLSVRVLFQGALSQSHRRIAELLDSSAHYRVAVVSPDEHEEPVACLILHSRSDDSPVPVLPLTPLDGRIIVLSDDMRERSIVDALEAGAHHYFSIDEPVRLVLARVHAALREHGGVFEQRLDVSPFRFDLDKREVSRAGVKVDLSPKEFEFAYYLFANRGRVIRNSELMTSVWSLPAAMDTRRIDTAACRIRKKMPLDHSSGWVLRRLRSVGYEVSACTVREAIT